MRTTNANIDAIGHIGAKEKLRDWFNGSAGVLLHFWEDVKVKYPVYKVVIAHRRGIYCARLFPEINYHAETEEDILDFDTWNISIDKDAEYPQGFTFDELPDANIPDLTAKEEAQLT